MSLPTQPDGKSIPVEGVESGPGGPEGHLRHGHGHTQPEPEPRFVQVLLWPLLHLTRQQTFEWVTSPSRHG